MKLPITALYTGILGCIYVVLAMRVSGARMKYKASLGQDASPELLEEVRRHANFAEWVPFAVLLMALCESNGSSAWLLHLAGGSLTVARVLHPFGVKHKIAPHPLRFFGAATTFFVVFALSLVLFLQGWVALF